MPRTDALQAPRSVATIRPHRFFPNGETAADTACQKASGADPDTIAARALAEFDSAVETLRTHGVEVHVFEDDGSRDTPDSVFPNNWFSTHPGGQIALERFCTHFVFEPVMFSAVDPKGQDVYHTNVLRCIGTDFALIGTSLITNPARRTEIVERLEETGRIVIDLAPEQIPAFAGNAIELTGEDGRILALSQIALDSLTAEQKARITRSAEIAALRVPTIELAAGSARCMIAGVHLARRSQPLKD